AAFPRLGQPCHRNGLLSSPAQGRPQFLSRPRDQGRQSRLSALQNLAFRRSRARRKRRIIEISDHACGLFAVGISAEGRCRSDLYARAKQGVTVLFEFQNYETDLTAHVGFGLHPGFGAASFESFRLQMPRGCYRRHFAPGNYLSGQTRDIEFAGGEMPFPRTELPGSIILEMVDVPRRTFSYVDPPSGRWVMLDLTGVPYLTLWSDGGPFLCVEPCWGLTDHHEQRPFENKEGIQTISPNGTLRAAFSMAPELASSD